MDQWEARMTPRPQREPRLDWLEDCWRMQSTNTGHELTCGIWRTDAGLELRASGKASPEGP